MVAADWYGLWLGAFIGCTLHFLIHIGQSIIIKKYIPALITSIIALPISCVIIYKSIHLLGYSCVQILMYSVIGTAIVIGNLALAHKLMKKFTKCIS